MSKITNRQAGALVRERREFVTGNKTVFAARAGRFYTVYSYGVHFPMYIHDHVTSTWIGNRDGYSVTTARHKGQCHPGQVDLWLDTDGMKRLLQAGTAQLSAARVLVREVFSDYPKVEIDKIVSVMGVQS